MLQRRMLAFVVILFLAANAGVNPAAAQDLSEAARQFERASAKHTIELGDLFNARGASQPPRAGGSITLREIELTLPVLQGGLLFYSFDEGELWAWLLNPGGQLIAYARQEVSRDSIDRTIHDLRRALQLPQMQEARAATPRGFEAPAADDSAPPVDDAVAAATSLLLPAPIAETLVGLRALIIVPALNIGTVPFSMLKPFGDESLFVDSLGYVLAPSLYDAYQQVLPWRRAPSAAIVGNPAFAAHKRWNLPALPGAEQEALEVAGIFGGTPLLGHAATIDAVQAAIARRPDILYFATHGVADPSDPLDGSFLALAPNASGVSEWTARAIQHSRLTGVQLAVLSACQTGLGMTHDAGVIGLARAFQLAGVPRVVMSLWNVDDAATAEFMVEYSRAILERSPAYALWTTMKVMRERRPDPRHWAPFVLFGSL